MDWLKEENRIRVLAIRPDEDELVPRLIAHVHARANITFITKGAETNANSRLNLMPMVLISKISSDIQEMYYQEKAPRWKKHHRCRLRECHYTDHSLDPDWYKSLDPRYAPPFPECSVEQDAYLEYGKGLYHLQHLRVKELYDELNGLIDVPKVGHWRSILFRHLICYRHSARRASTELYLSSTS